jgi:hypothetical protein
LGYEEKQWRGWIQVWYIWHIVRTFVNVNVQCGTNPAQQ